MFVYLSKKIAIPNNVKLHSVSWNNDQGWIACGGDDGLLKVLKLENTATGAPGGGVSNNATAGTDQQMVDGGNYATLPGKAGPGGAAYNAGAGKGLNAPSNLSMNQTLEGHSGSVIVSTWNMHQRKLTTSDQYGLIIVWVLYRGMWYEEMVNNRNKSVVADMRWNREGERICIIYEDGAIIVGSVDGNRIWGKELKDQLLFLQWSPDSKYVLFATKTGGLQLFDEHGNYMNSVQNFCGDSRVAGMDWYNGSHGYIETPAPCLAICFENGKIQINRGENDKAPTIIDTNMKSMKLTWNKNGTILAVAGAQSSNGSQGEEKEVCVAQFYDQAGQHLRSLKVPGKRLSSLSWEYSGLRIALAVDSFIYFANVRPDYKWTYFADTLVYAFNRADRAETDCVFWNSKTGERFVKYLSKLYGIHSTGDNCVISSKSDETENQYVVAICNAIGTTIESHYIEFAPIFSLITKTHVFVASKEIVLWWQFKGQLIATSTVLDGLRKKDNKEKMIHIDDMTSIGGGDSGQTMHDMRKKRPTTDPITCISANESALIIARQSGSILHFDLPSVTLLQKYSITYRPQSVSLNSNGRRLSIIDIAGVLRILELYSKNYSDRSSARPIARVPTNGTSGSSEGKLLDFERKDVWDLTWADDNPDTFAMMEKTRMYVFRNLEPEEPISCTGYICNFDNLQITAVLLDEIMSNPENPMKDHLLRMETKSLRDTRNILGQVGLPDAVQFVENHPHPRLWRLIGDAALEQLDFVVARRAYVRCIDYQGLQFIKRIQKIDDVMKQRAEIAAYFSRFDDAEKLYLQIDRRDLAVNMRMRLGDWFRVVQLVKLGGSAGEDALVEKSWDAIGEYYFERQKWAQAVTYYAQARNLTRLSECYYILEDYDALEKLVTSLPENAELSRVAAYKFLSVGLCEQAVAAFMKCGDVKAAVDSCVKLNQWDMAVELAEKHRLKEIEALFAKYATYLLDQNKRLQAIELYRKANFCHKSARLLYDFANEAIREGQSLLRIKKLFVLAALEMERYHDLNKARRKGNGGATGGGIGFDGEIGREMGSGSLVGINSYQQDDPAAALNGLLNEDANSAEDMKLLNGVWRGAEAYHYYMLAQKQYYDGNYQAALTTATVLKDYEDLIPPRSIYNLIALCGLRSQNYETCSKAFVRLEALDLIPPSESSTSLSDIPNEEKMVHLGDENSTLGREDGPDDDPTAGETQRLGRSYETLAFCIFTAYAPVNPKSGHVSCTNCAALFSERENTCPNCQITFPTCIATGQPILEYHHFMCHTCKHRAIESEISGLTCCPLCHTIL